MQIFKYQQIKNRMKNYLTITTILAAGTLALNAATTVVFDFGRTDDESYKTPGAICIGKGLSGAEANKYQDVYTASGMLGDAMTGNYSFTQDATGGGYGNSATLATGEENGWKNHLTEVPAGWTDTFKDGLTSQYDSASQSGNKFTLSFTGLASGYYNLSALGGYYGQDNIVPTITFNFSGNGLDFKQTTMTATSINDGAQSTSSATGSLTANLANKNSNEGYTLDVSNIFVGTSGELTFTITGGATGSQRTPLNGIKLTLVPEPSAFGLLAGLGALALVGARRRRK